MNHYYVRTFLKHGFAAALALLACGAATAATIEVKSGEKKLAALDGNDAVVSGTGILRLTGSEPLKNAKVDIQGTQAQLILEGALCSEVQANYLSMITIDGKPFDPERDRLAIYGNGSEIIPAGKVDPLTIYTEENFGGDSRVCQQDIYYRGKKIANKNNFLTQEKLEGFNNNIRSFRLKRGYSATFANNDDGTGYSRVFTAYNGDLEVTEMPEGLEFASFIRVCRNDRIGKRGICGLSVTPITRSSWYYSWGASDESQIDFEFIPMRHGKWWDGWDKIGSRENSSQVLGYNEPDHADQSNLSPDFAISEWDNFMKSGLRAGSPAPDAIEKDWLKKFLATADSLNYRVDFVATHMYWNSQKPADLCEKINRLCRDTYGGRPMWITEWNNGANWTHEAWPDKSGTRLDAEFNILLDENGNQTTVNRPHTQANSDVQKAWLSSMLTAFDDCEWLERHSFYNWVEDARSVVIEDKLTPAGKVFAEHHSVPGFNEECEHIHEWRIAPPFPKLTTYSSYATLSFTDHNGETGTNYIIERRVDRGPWEVFATKTLGENYQAGKVVNVNLPYDRVGLIQLRVKATSYKGDESIYSRVVGTRVETVGIENVETADFTVEVRDGQLAVSSPKAMTCTIWSVDGRAVRNFAVTPDNEVTVDGLAHGIYIVNGVKVAL